MWVRGCAARAPGPTDAYLVVLDDAHSLQGHEPAVRVRVDHLGADLVDPAPSRRLRAPQLSTGEARH